MSELAEKDERQARYEPKTMLWALASMTVSGATTGLDGWDFRRAALTAAAISWCGACSSEVTGELQSELQWKRKERRKRKREEKEGDVLHMSGEKRFADIQIPSDWGL